MFSIIFWLIIIYLFFGVWGKRSQNYGGRQSKNNSGHTLQEQFVICLFGLMAKIAKADGKVSLEEAEFINNAAKNNFQAYLNIIRDVIQQEKRFPKTLQFYFSKYGAWTCHPTLKELFMQVLCDSALADHNLSQAEMTILHQIEAMLGMTGFCRYYINSQQHQYGHTQNQRQSPNDLGHCYKLLGITENATDKEIKTAYRKLCKEYHPDVLQSKGLPDELLKKAEQKMKQINAAYETVCKARGI